MAISKPPYRPSKRDDGPRINHNIIADEIRVVGPEGEMLGLMTVGGGIRAAEEYGLDLVEISPNATPPVCKILDYSKYKYEQQKKASEARKKQKTVDIKEIKMRPTIEDHDYGVKLKAARKFLNAENKVKVTIRFRGREMAHKDIAFNLLDRFRDDLADLSKVEFSPKMEGRQMIMILGPDVVALEAAKKEQAKAEKLAAKEAAKANNQPVESDEQIETADKIEDQA